MGIRYALLAVGMAVVLAPAQATSIATPTDHVTVPLIVEANRPFVDVTLRRADGSSRSARFLVDSGGGSFIVTEALARDLSLRWGTASHEDGADFAPVTSALAAWIGGLPLQLDPSRSIVQIGSGGILPAEARAQAEGMLPGHVLSRYHVVLDYPARTFSLGPSGAFAPHGDPLPMPVNRRSGFARTEVRVSGTAFAMLVDTGASFTMVSEVVLKRWAAQHSDWPRHPGAFGDATTLGGATLETMFVPHGAWGTFGLDDWGVTSQRAGTFEKYMSAMTSGAIVGSLAGNVLKFFRLELDYAGERLYLSRP